MGFILQMGSRIWNGVKEIIDNLDPLALLMMGVPDNEYDPEIETFVDLISDGVEVTPEKCKEVMDKWFWEDCCTDAMYKKMSQKLMWLARS